MSDTTKNIIWPKQWEVDIVYIWCDANNPDYVANRKLYSQKHNINSYWSPTRDNDEIRHSIKSVRMHMTWVRNIFVCAPEGHRIKNLNTEKYNIRYVSNHAILGKENCPNFNSHSLELFTYKIKWLSDYFIQCNDDFFIGGDLPLDDFYNFETQKIKYYYENFLHLGVGSSSATQKIIFDLIQEKHYFWATHSPRMYYKNDIKNIIELYPETVENTKISKFRTPWDIQLTHLYGYYLLSKDKGEFIFLKNILHNNGLIHLISILLWKITSEGILATISQIYIEYFYKKRLHKNKIFSDKNLYWLIRIGNNPQKNRKNIDLVFKRDTRFICLNDSYKDDSQDKWNQIVEQNYNYFYSKLLKTWRK